MQLLWKITVALILASVGVVCQRPMKSQIPETAYKREVFWVGGQLTTDPSNGYHRFIDQMYVEHLVPANRAVTKPYPLVFIHGTGGTGAVWLNTPDGRKGWASWFLEQGYEVYLVDCTEIARSGRASSRGALEPRYAELVEQLFTAGKKHGNWPQAVLHTQFPGTGELGDPIFDTFYRSFVQAGAPQEALILQETMRAAGVALLKRIGKAVFIAHSLGGYYPLVIADARPDLVAGIVSLEPVGPPFEELTLSTIGGAATRVYGLTTAPLKYDPPVKDPKTDLVTEKVGTDTPSKRACVLQKEPAKKLVNIAKVPMMILDSEAGFVAPYGHCYPAYLRQCGVKTDYIRLQDLGIHGNGHFMFLEKNNLKIAPVVEAWLSKTLR